MANPLYNQKLIADFERVCLSWEYSHETGNIENTSGATVNLLPGVPYPVKAGSGANLYEVMTAAESGTPTNIVGFIVTNRAEEIATGAASMEEYAILVRGCVVVSLEGWNKFDGDPIDDLAGAAYDPADFVTFCEAAVPPIVVSNMTGALKQVPYRL